jgi:pyroglutamyl-peptidase
MREKSVALVTGFEPYGGREINPAALVMKHMAGLEIEGARVVGRVLPVSFGALRSRTRELMHELNPRVVVSLGLWPGEPVIRLERVAVNIADFEIADNEGSLVRDDVVEDAAPIGMASTLPLRAIESALLAARIPVRLSASAGTFLCNTTMYAFLRTAPALAGARCGFVHLPYLPEQVAALLQELRKEQQLELHQRADLASMSLDTMVEAVRIVLAVSLTSSE